MVLFQYLLVSRVHLCSIVHKYSHGISVKGKWFGCFPNLVPLAIFVCYKLLICVVAFYVFPSSCQN